MTPVLGETYLGKKLSALGRRLSVGMGIMRGYIITTPSTSYKGGSNVKFVLQLPEVVVEVTDSKGEWGRKWSRVRLR